MLTGAIFNVITLTAVMLNVVMQNVVILNVVAPTSTPLMIDNEMQN